MNSIETIISELKSIRESLADSDAAMSAPAAAKFVGLGLKTFNRLIKANIGPKYYPMPDGRRFTKRDLIQWREERFSQQQLRKVI